MSKSGIGGIDYCINPFVGCSHGCLYCYASFMKKYTGHREPWGAFVDVKTNAPSLLERQLRKATSGTIVLSSVTDPYQPAERTYRVTRRCLEVLAHSGLSVEILTKSPLILRDADLLKTLPDVKAGLTITTDNDSVRRLFEPGAPPIEKRIKALESLRAMGISTYAFIGPVLPMNPEMLAGMIEPHVDSILIDRMNYPSKTVAVYRKNGFEEWLDRSFADGIVARLGKAFKGIQVELY
ncbi:MAG: Radical SAM superfamily protein [Syntrophorhabdaceae bacterium PtaU1.Bin034]|nr:MAG: Radical SAM superfamily protein [Syntrophorhabdaceae bacterium PtaU1.Bin034]